MAYSKKKRFVAGAICPRCESQDTVVVFSLEGKDYRECVSCDFKDELNFPEHPSELKTRVSEGEKIGDVQVITMVPSAKRPD